MSLRGSYKTDLTYQVGYTLSRSIDASTDFRSGQDLSVLSNPYVGWRYDLGPSAFDRTNVLFANFVYDLPFLKHSQSHMMRTTLGGWQLSGIVSMSSGAPINITVGGGVVNALNLNSATNRPDLVGKISYPKSGTHWIDGSAFQAPAIGTWGNLAHNAVVGPGRDNWNLALFKSLVFNEERGIKLEFRAESFNTFNHTQFQADVTGGIHNDIGDANFGQITQTFDPRTMQLGLKLIF
jgi:hypothetical protein